MVTKTDDEPAVIKEREVIREEGPRRSSTGTVMLILLILLLILVLFTWKPWGDSGGSDINVPAPTTTTQ